MMCATYIFEQLYAFFSRDAPHHHPIGALSIQYPINQVIHSELAHDALDFGIVI
jgi:hypothetical protein